MKKHVCFAIIFLLIELPCFSMKQKLFSKAKSASEVEVMPVQRMDGALENFPTLYVAALSQTIGIENAKEFLDLHIPSPTMTIREYINLQEFRDTHNRASRHEHENHINQELSRVIFAQDERVVQSTTYLHNQQLTELNYGKIRTFLQNILSEKISNEQHRQKEWWYKLFKSSYLGLNVGIVAGLGAFLLCSQYEHKAAGYAFLGSGLLGGCIIAPKIWRSCSALRCSKNTVKNYKWWFQVLEGTSDENFEVLNVTN